MKQDVTWVRRSYTSSKFTSTFFFCTASPSLLCGQCFDVHSISSRAAVGALASKRDPAPRWPFFDGAFANRSFTDLAGRIGDTLDFLLAVCWVGDGAVRFDGMLLASEASRGCEQGMTWEYSKILCATTCFACLMRSQLAAAQTLAKYSTVECTRLMYVCKYAMHWQHCHASDRATARAHLPPAMQDASLSLVRRLCDSRIATTPHFTCASAISQPALATTHVPCTPTQTHEQPRSVPSSVHACPPSQPLANMSQCKHTSPAVGHNAVTSAAVVCSTLLHALAAKRSILSHLQPVARQAHGACCNRPHVPKLAFAPQRLCIRVMRSAAPDVAPLCLGSAGGCLLGSLHNSPDVRLQLHRAKYSWHASVLLEDMETLLCKLQQQAHCQQATR